MAKWLAVLFAVPAVTALGWLAIGVQSTTKAEEASQLDQLEHQLLRKADIEAEVAQKQRADIGALFSEEEVQDRQIERELEAIEKRRMDLQKQRAALHAQRQQQEARRVAEMGMMRGRGETGMRGGGGEGMRGRGGIGTDMMRGGRGGPGRGGDMDASMLGGLNPSPSVHARIIWEYLDENFSGEDANKRGQEGWELVNVYTAPRDPGEAETSPRIRAAYKRPVDANADQATQQSTTSAVPTQPGDRDSFWATTRHAAEPAPGPSESGETNPNLLDLPEPAPNPPTENAEQTDIDLLLDAPAPPGFRQ